MSDPTRRARHRIIAMIAIVGAVYLVGNGRVPLWDRDEPRYAQASRQMLHSGDWVVPRFLDKPRVNKPPLIYWLQAGSMKWLGETDFAARLPSVVAMVATLVVLGASVWCAAGPRRAAWTIFIFATCGMTLAAAKMAITDSVLLVWILGAQLCVYQIWRGRATWWTYAVLGLAVAFGGLAKGPVILGVMGMTLLALWGMRAIDRHRTGEQIREGEAPAEPRVATMARRGPRPASVMGGVILAVILAAVFLAPWLVAIERRIPGYTLRTLGAEIVDRSRRPMEGHNGPPGYYAMTIWGTYFPWSLLLPLAVVYAWRNRHVPQVRFALGAVVGPWVMFELVQTKLTHYLLPVYPFLAFLTADALIRCIRRGKGDLYDATWVKVTAGWALLVAALGLAPWAVLRAWPSRDPWLIAGLVSFSVTGLAYGWFVYSRFRQRRVAGAATAMGLGMLVVVIVGYAWVLPRLEFMRLSQRVADDLRRLGATAAGDVVMIDYKEPSLAFYLGGTIREAPEGYLSSLPPERWPMYVVLTAEVWRTTPSGVRERLDVLAAHRGLAYADGGRVVDVMVLRRRP